MIFVIAAAIGLVAAILRRVSVSRLADARFRGLGVLLAAVILHLVLTPSVTPAGIVARLALPIAPGLPALGDLLYLISLGCTLAFVYLNRRLPGLTLILLGLTLNFLVIAANGGHMPGDPGQLARAGILQDDLEGQAKGLWSPFSLIGPDTPLAFLADIIYLPVPFRQPTVASVGDFVLALGVVAFFNQILPPWLPRRRARLAPRAEG